jgi:hypothetical protein
MSESANSLELISNLNKVIEKRGLNKTTEKILQEEIVSLIKVLVCENFEITEKKLLFGNSRKHNRRWALSFFCYFVHLSLNCTQKEVSKMISRTNACVSKYIKDVITLSDAIVYEKELLERKIQIEKLLKEKINHILRYGEEKQ